LVRAENGNTVTTIREGMDLCTVIVTVDADPALMEELEAHARDGLPQFAEFSGFISGTLHKSEDGGRLINYLQWESAADHQACMNDPRWDSLPSAQRFRELMESGEARVDVRTFEVLLSAPNRH